MFEADRTSEYTVVGAFAYHFRKMFNAKVMLEKGDKRQWIQKRLNIWSREKDFFEQIERLSYKQIGAFLQALAELDCDFKTGRAQVQNSMELFVHQIANIS